MWKLIIPKVIICGEDIKPDGNENAWKTRLTYIQNINKNAKRQFEFDRDVTACQLQMDKKKINRREMLIGCT